MILQPLCVFYCLVVTLLISTSFIDSVRVLVRKRSEYGACIFKPLLWVWLIGVTNKKHDLPYSGKISRVAIFADEGLRSFSRFYFRGSRGLARIHAQCLIYGKGRYPLFFEVTNFAVWRRSAKTAKINTLENFPLYGIAFVVPIGQPWRRLRVFLRFMTPWLQWALTNSPRIVDLVIFVLTLTTTTELITLPLCACARGNKLAQWMNEWHYGNVISTEHACYVEYICESDRLPTTAVPGLSCSTWTWHPMYNYVTRFGKTCHLRCWLIIDYSTGVWSWHNKKFDKLYPIECLNFAVLKFCGLDSTRV